MYKIGQKRYPFPVNPMLGNVETETQPMGLLGGMDPMTMGLLGAGAAMLEASGPSRTPVSLGQAMGRGLMGGLSGYQTGQGMQNDQEKMRIMAEKAQQELQGGTPYSTIHFTNQGPMQWDVRAGMLTPVKGMEDVRPIQQDPMVRRQIAQAEAEEKARYDLYPEIDPSGARYTQPKAPGAIPRVQTDLAPYEKTAFENTARVDVERGADADKKDRQAGSLSELIATARGILETKNPSDTWFEGKRDDVQK